VPHDARAARCERDLHRIAKLILRGLSSRHARARRPRRLLPRRCCDCRADAGATKAFTCSYHGWSYDTSGRLVNVPNQDDYPDHFAQDRWGLLEVAGLDSYKGLVFATWNPEAPPLVEALGGMTWYMDAMLDRDPEGTEVVGGVHKWVLEGNWKLAAE
jgi:3-phenylpropionate/trans-cinnamate dioxygenase alpha subunit